MASRAATSRAQLLKFPKDPTQARDELNLCEFPIAVLSDRVPKGALELSYCDTIWDRSESRKIERRLHISAPPKYGLPTAKDEEVLLALIYLTDQTNQFSCPTVQFTRYELIKLLGWNGGGKSYQRVSESLARWKSVTLDYRNAWRDHRAKSWVSEVFSLIDNVTLYDVDRWSNKPNPDSDQLNLPLSSFTWNRIFFDSMQAKFYKRLDFRFYQGLSTPTAKRIFRFLDKRFGSGRSHWEFDLHEFAREHIGLSRNYDTGKIKEKLMPAIHELEEKGYLRVVSKGERFSRRGKFWRVAFTREGQRFSSTNSEVKGDLVALLASRGVSRPAAEEIALLHPDQKIREQIDVFDWIIDNHADSLTNPGGFLAESIRSGFQPPASYQSKLEQKNSARRQQEVEELHRRKKEVEKSERDRIRQRQEHIERVRENLGEVKIENIEREAITLADEIQKQALDNPSLREFQLRLLTDQLIIQRFPCVK